ncbi:MAG: STAS domain-containing protein [bacterium]
MEINTDSILRCITIKGRLDAMSSNELEFAVSELTGTGEDLVIDMSECNYLSSAGIRILLQTKKKLHPAQCDLFLTGVSTEVMRVLEIAGLAGTFRFEDHVKAALALMEAGRISKLGTTDISVGHHKLIYHPVGDEKITGKYINVRKEITIEELGYAMGFGSISETDAGHSDCQDLFVSIKKGFGFLPPENAGDPDFRMISCPEKTAISLCEALSFGHKPSGMLKLASPGLLSFSEVNEAVAEVSAKIFSPGSVTLRIVANFDMSAPSLSIFLAKDENFADLVRETGLRRFAKLLDDKTGTSDYIGIRILLSNLEISSEKMAPEEILRKNLTFENIMAVRPFSMSSFLEDPVVWLFNAGSFTLA